MDSFFLQVMLLPIISHWPLTAFESCGGAAVTKFTVGTRPRCRPMSAPAHTAAQCPPASRPAAAAGGGGGGGTETGETQARVPACLFYNQSRRFSATAVRPPVRGSPTWCKARVTCLSLLKFKTLKSQPASHARAVVASLHSPRHLRRVVYTTRCVPF